jgi:hypothetical protein
MYGIKGNNDKFNTVDEFIDNLNRGGEIEFIYNNKRYSITHDDNELCFIEQYKNNSIKYFHNIQELLEFHLEENIIKDIITIIQPIFRCF